MRFWLTIPSSIVTSTLPIEFEFFFDQVLADEAGGLDNILITTESSSTCVVQVDSDAPTAFRDDFESPRFCFSGSELESSAQATMSTFLGRFSNTRLEATYQFIGLDTASSFQLEFDMYQIDTLFGGNDRFFLTLGDQTINFGAFLNSQSGANPTKTGTSPNGDISYTAVSLGAPEELGFGSGITAFQEETMRFTLIIPNTVITSPWELTFRFQIDENIANESAGIDNVSLTKV